MTTLINDGYWENYFGTGTLSPNGSFYIFCFVLILFFFSEDGNGLILNESPSSMCVCRHILAIYRDHYRRCCVCLPFALLVKPSKSKGVKVDG